MSSSMLTVLTALGWVGAFAALFAYGMASKGKWTATSTAFQVTNMGGAAIMVAVSAANGVWPSAAANFAWIVVGAQTLLMVRRTRLEQARQDAEQSATMTADEPVALSAPVEIGTVVEVRSPAEVGLAA